MAAKRFTTARKRLAKTLQSSYKRVVSRISNFKNRRPHRSFRITNRRDYKRSLKLPGYWAFTADVIKTLLAHKRLFITLAFISGTVAITLGGITDQQTYTQIADTLQSATADNFSGGWSKLGQAGLLSVAAFSGGTSSVSAVQQVYVGLTLVLSWLVTVWLLRELLAGRKPRLRDGLYNAGAPLIPTVLVTIIFILQLLPLGLLAIAYLGLSSVGLANEGFGALLFYALGVTVAALTLYWLTSTFIALVVVTLPGMYPFRAIAAASDIVIGRRLRVMYRLLWLFVLLTVAWFVIMIPLILLDSWLRGMWSWMSWVPLVPLTVSVLASTTIVLVSSYVYLLYRKVVEDDAKPA